MPRSLSDWESAFVAGQDGDRHAYRAFLEAAEAHLKRFFARKAPPADAADLVQDVLIALHTKRASYDPAYPLMPWVNTIAKYKWIDWLRKTHRVTHVELDDTYGDPGTPQQPAAGHAVGMLLNNLPRRQAEAIRLVKLQGMTIAEASAVSGQSESLVKVNIHRGLKKLSAFVYDEGEAI
ncbi:sigma-70 family RNA polymerase sigma factor [Pacificimonas sp. WHA3]|uniref:Sigma-70 family RNA polymerase sigma factor n=1 Tax=Pacificimonas pallii TaxID=2827236 RepID=A0ABS6SFD4_9SPHN|nr:sigma-70 family RNA polymerase sigma factor [Pacificimonas pallii]MBV7256636.1 sigma-70 family RNA polymerase sigma factor [Pacificimonas pallii]